MQPARKEKGLGMKEEGGGRWNERRKRRKKKDRAQATNNTATTTPGQKEGVKSSAVVSLAISSFPLPVSPFKMERGGHAGRKAKDQNESVTHLLSMWCCCCMLERPYSLPAAFQNQEEAAWGGGGTPAQSS